MGEVVSLNGHRKYPAFLDAKDLVAEDEPDRAWVIEGLVEREGRILLAGAEGCGKSLLALTAAAQAAAGIKVLDRFEVDLPATTVYFDLEMGRSTMRRRVKQLSISAGLEDGALFIVHRPEGLDLSSAKERHDLFAFLDEISPDFIVIDPLYKLMETESVYERDVRPTIKALDEMRTRYQCGLLLVHHLRKRASGEASRGKDSSDVFGSSVLLRWPEVTMLLNEQTLVVSKDRDANFGGNKPSFPVRRGGKWPIWLDDPSAPPDEDVLNVLREMGPMTRAQVIKTAHRRAKDVGDALKRLEALGKVRHIDGVWESVR